MLISRFRNALLYHVRQSRSRHSECKCRFWCHFEVVLLKWLLRIIVARSSSFEYRSPRAIAETPMSLSSPPHPPGHQNKGKSLGDVAQISNRRDKSKQVQSWRSRRSRDQAKGGPLARWSSRPSRRCGCAAARTSTRAAPSGAVGGKDPA